MTLHYLEAPNKFKKQDMDYCEQTVEKIRVIFSGRMLSDYDDNLMIFKRRD